MQESHQPPADPRSEETAGERPAPEQGSVPERILLEVVVQSVRDARAAEAGGADRLELCQALVDGGLTPPATLVAAVVEAVSLPVFVLLRPRGGDFVLDDEDLELLRADVRASREAGAAGVVLGALTPDGDVDLTRLARLVATARPLEVTFHRAFDHARDQREAFEALRTLGVDRVLTSGAAPTAEVGARRIAELQAHAGARGIERPRLIAGAGVRGDNVVELVRRTGVREVHSSASGPRPSPARHVNRAVPMGPTQAALRHGVEELEVRSIVEALGALAQT